MVKVLLRAGPKLTQQLRRQNVSLKAFTLLRNAKAVQEQQRTAPFAIKNVNKHKNLYRLVGWPVGGRRRKIGLRKFYRLLD